MQRRRVELCLRSSGILPSTIARRRTSPSHTTSCIHYVLETKVVVPVVSATCTWKLHSLDCGAWFQLHVWHWWHMIPLRISIPFSPWSRSGRRFIAAKAQLQQRFIAVPATVAVVLFQNRDIACVFSRSRFPQQHYYFGLDDVVNVTFSCSQ